LDPFASGRTTRAAEPRPRGIEGGRDRAGVRGTCRWLGSGFGGDEGGHQDRKCDFDRWGVSRRGHRVSMFSRRWEILDSWNPGILDASPFQARHCEEHLWGHCHRTRVRRDRRPTPPAALGLRLHGIGHFGGRVYRRHGLLDVAGEPDDLDADFGWSKPTQ
jgi:hypothetical protein